MRRLVVTGALALAALIPAHPAQATVVGCNSATFTIGLNSGGEKIAVLHASATRCWDQFSHLTTGTRVNGVRVNDTILGSIYGFQTDMTGPYLSSKDGTEWVYRTDFTTRPCLFYYLNVCGHSADFSARVFLVQPNHVQALFGRYLWGVPFCTNSWCRGHLKFGN